MDFANKDGSMMQQAHHIWSMLDDMAQNNPQAYRKFIDKQMKEAKELRQPPIPHMCVHTKNLKTSGSLYVNICHWHKVPVPKSDTAPIPVCGGEIYQETIDGKLCDLVTVAFNEKVLEEFGIDSSLMEERNMLINLALNYIEDQHKLEVSRSFVAFPKKTAFKGSKEQLEKSFMRKYQRDGEGVNDEKFQNDLTELEKSFGPLAEGCKDTLLAKLANMDDSDSNYDQKDDQVNDKSLLDQLTNISVSADPKEKVRKTNKQTFEHETTLKDSKDKLPSPQPKIQELNNEDTRKNFIETENVVTSEKTQCEKPTTKPQYTINTIEEDSGKKLCIKIKLEGVKSVSECDLHVAQDSIELRVTDLYYLKLTLPFSVNEDEAEAKFKRKSHSLTLNIPAL